MQPTRYPIQMDGYDPEMQAAGISAPQMPMQQGGMPERGRPTAQPNPLARAPINTGMQERGRPVAEQDGWNQLTPAQKQIAQNAPPEKQGELMKLLMGGFGAEANAADADMSRADALRQDQRATGQTVGPDNIYVGANPLEHLADGIRGYQGMRDFKDAKTARTDAFANAATKRERLGELFAGREGSMVPAFLRGE